MSEQKLFYLTELANYKVASKYPDVRGWDIRDATKKLFGKVDNMLVDKNEKRVVYLDVEVDQSIIDNAHVALNTLTNEDVHNFSNKEGESHLLIPIELVQIDEENKYVHSNEIDYNTLTKVRRFSKGSQIDPDYELAVRQQYSASRV